MRNLLNILAAATMVALIVSCEKDDDNQIGKRNMDLNISGLGDLGEGFVYEGWLVKEGNPVSTGTFTVDSAGGLSQSQFEVEANLLDSANSFFLTIESSPDDNPAPASTRVLAGNFSGNSASLSVAHGGAIGTDLTSASGRYILATPTDGGMDSNENSGIWWINPANGPGRGLELPELGTGWKYEGWAEIDGQPMSTGKFQSVVNEDESASYSGTTASGYAFPGEDFLLNAPSGFDFPVNLAGRKVFVSVEPDPDNHPSPFVIRPLTGQVPNPALAQNLYDMNNNATSSNPTGSVSR
ncbi:MAG TPA: anti-sigma factor [Membranihabitans sp.]|nr:anti-sigma factor [Membranihabitans sp.]